jgi:hypothetical protein
MSLDRIQSDVSHIKETMARMEKAISSIDKALYRGNGTPAIVPTVKANCEKINKVILETEGNTDFVKSVKITMRNFKFLVWIIGSINVGGLIAVYNMFSNLVK